MMIERMNCEACRNETIQMLRDYADKKCSIGENALAGD